MTAREKTADLAPVEAWLLANVGAVVETVEAMGGRRFIPSEYAEHNGPNPNESLLIGAAVWLWWQVEECEAPIRELPAAVQLWRKVEREWELAAGWL